MKNKKGFTLVELLAVIAILAVLVILALPNIVRMFQQSRKNSFQVEANSIYTSAKKQYVSDNFSTPGNKVYGSKADRKLNITSRSDLDYYVEMDGSGNIVKYCVKDGAYQFYYEGARLNDDEINDIQEIANLNETEVLTIDGSGCDIEKNIEVCYYSYYVTTLDLVTNYTYLNMPIGLTKECTNKQTVEECLGRFKIANNLYADYKYLYNTSKSHPGNNLTSCFNANNPRNIEIQNSYYVILDNYKTKCTNNLQYFKNNINPNDKVLPSSQGCYSPRQIGILCLGGDSEIEVYDKKKKKRVKKKLKDITYDDLILCWDFVKGEYTYAKPLWIMKPSPVDSYTVLTFSDGTKLTVMGDHRIYNLDTEMFTSCIKESDSPIGMRTINSKGEIITLVKREKINEPNMAYNVIVDKHINMYANGILTSRGLNNLYPMSGMKYVKEDREVFTREELSEIPDEYFYGLNLGETPRTFMGSEERTKEHLVSFVERTINTKL